MVVWNILHGGGPNRVAPIALTIASHSPDVVILTEFRERRGGQIRAVLADHGLTHQTVTIGPTDNGVLIATRSPHAPAEHTPFPGRWLHVSFCHSPGVPALELLAVHAPDDARPEFKAEYFHRLIGFARPRRESYAVIAGDFNTARRGADTQTVGVRCEALLGTLYSLGFTDAWRLRHPESRESTWISSFGEGGRIDAALLSAPLAASLLSCHHDHAPRDAGLSDHSLLKLDFQALAPACEQPHEPTPAGLFRPGPE